MQSYEDKLDAELKVEIGTTETPLDSRRATVRGEEAAIGNLIADAMRERSAPTSPSPMAAASAPTANIPPARS